jgi:hypothetical protein
MPIKLLRYIYLEVESLTEEMAKIAQKSLLLLLMSLASCLLYAQPKLAIDSAWTLPNDTVDWNGNAYILEYRAIVTNVGNNKLDGPVKLSCHYNGDSTTWDVANFDVLDFEVGDTQLVRYADTIYNINGNRYKGGDNIIVIWPRAEDPGVQAPDTVTHNIHIKNLVPQASPDPRELARRIRVYPNPVGQRLNLDYQRDVHKLEYVRVSNLSGQVITRSNSAVEAIDFGTLPAGLYMLEVRYRDGVWGSYRILHE